MNALSLLPDRVFDSVAGVMLEDHVVPIRGGYVDRVLPATESNEGVTRLEGKTIVPGLIDVHTHLVGRVDSGRGYSELVERSGAQEALIGVKHASETLRTGFTTVRDIGTFRAFADVALREAIDEGWVEGPRMMCAGAYVTCPGGGGDITGLAVDVDEMVPRELRFGVTTGVDHMRSNTRQILGMAPISSRFSPPAPSSPRGPTRGLQNSPRRSYGRQWRPPPTPGLMSPPTPTGAKGSNGR